MRAAMGRVQLGRLRAATERRRRLTERYWDALDGIAGLGLPFRDAPAAGSHHLMPTLLPSGTDRTALAKTLRGRGIQTSVHYRPIHEMSLYREMNVSLPRTEAIAARELTPPMFAGMTEAQVDLVVEELGRALGG